MAREISVTYTCDFDGSSGAMSVQFGMDGREYEIDLCVFHEEDLSIALAPYLKAARKAQPKRRRVRTLADRDRSAHIRAWAKQRGYKVNDRGRIRSEITADYERAERS